MGDEETTTETEQPKRDADTGSDTAEVEKWKALARKHEDQAKKNAEAAQKLEELEQSQKTEVERLTEQVQSLTKERDQAASKADRIEVAVLKSLDEDKAKRITSAAKRLTGTTREELEADADEFIPLLGGGDPDPKPAPPGKPREQLRPGSADSDTPAEETDVKKLAERMFSS